MKLDFTLGFCHVAAHEIEKTKQIQGFSNEFELYFHC